MDVILELKKVGYEIYVCVMVKDGLGVDVVDYFVEINILDLEVIIDYIEKN